MPSNPRQPAYASAEETMHTQAELSLFPMQPVARRPETWWTRNWIWVLSLLLCLFAGLVIFFTTVVSLSAVSTIRSSGALNAAIARAGELSPVTDRLGTPISLNGFPEGTVSFEETEGFADVRIPISGPKGEAKLLAIGEKNNGRWDFSSMSLEYRGETTELIK
jgi:cytochrome oxidase complex assembly protein 1